MKGCDFIRGEALGPLCSVPDALSSDILGRSAGPSGKVLRSQKMLSSWRKPKKTIGLNLLGASGQDLRDHNQRPRGMGAGALDFNPSPSTLLLCDPRQAT